MALVIAIRGAESEKIVGGVRKKVVPFVGADREGEFAQLGLGLIYPDESKWGMWGLFAPHMLIKSWRGMKMLEHIDQIDAGTFAACWYAGGYKITGHEKGFLNMLAEKLGGIEQLKTLRQEVLASAPIPVELDAMIAVLREKGVSVAGWELEEEVKAGRIVMLPIIETIRQEEAEQREADKREQEEIAKPLPPEESLGVFFKELGIYNFILGPAIGGYGMDWDHIELSKLDQLVKSDSSSEYLPDGHHLEHTTQVPHMTTDEIEPGVTVYRTTFGEVEEPYYIATDGTRYTFLFAKFRNEHFFLKTKVEKKDGDPTESEYTLAQLRELIGPLPPPAHEVPKGFVARLISWLR